MKLKTRPGLLDACLYHQTLLKGSHAEDEQIDGISWRDPNAIMYPQDGAFFVVPPPS